MTLERLATKVEKIETNDDLIEIDKVIRLYASNLRTLDIYNLCDRIKEKCILLDNKKILVNIYGYQISIIYNFKNKLHEVSELIERMLKVSTEIKYNEGLAWAYSYEWYIAKFHGNKSKGAQSLNKAIKILEETSCSDLFIYHFVFYSYGVERWMENNDANSVLIFEECVDYYKKQGYYRSLAQALSMLILIYQQTHNIKKSSKLVRKILINDNFLNEIPKEIQSIIHFFIGFSHGLEGKLLDYLEKQYSHIQSLIE